MGEGPNPNLGGGVPIQPWTGGRGGPNPTLDGGLPIQHWMGGSQSNIGWGGSQSNIGWGGGGPNPTLDGGGPNPTLDGGVPIQPWTEGGSPIKPIPACYFDLTSMVSKLQLSSLPVSCSLYSPQPHGILGR